MKIEPPPKKDHMLGVKIEKTLWCKLRLHSGAVGGSVGYLVRRILIEWVAKQEGKTK